MTIWSLVHEMRISIIFPVIVFLLLKIDWKICIIFAMIFSVVSSFFMKNFTTEFNTPISTNYFITFHYISMFIIGALLAKNREYLINKIANLKLKCLFLCFGLGVLFLNYPRLIYAVFVKL